MIGDNISINENCDNYKLVVGTCGERNQANLEGLCTGFVDARRVAVGRVELRQHTI